MARIPYLNEWTIGYALTNTSGVLVQPTSIACAVTNANSSAVTVAGVPTWDSTSSTTLLSFTKTEVSASAYATRWTATWTGTACGTDFTDVESLIIVAPGQEEWHTTVCEAKEYLNVTDATDDDLIAGFIESAQDALTVRYDMPTVPKVTEQRKFRCTNTLILTDELVSVTAVYDASNNSIADYTILYGRRPNDLYRGIILEDPYDEYISVSGTWGYDNTPADVNRALMLAVSTWYKRSTLGDANDVIGGFSSLAKETRDIMDARETPVI